MNKKNTLINTENIIGATSENFEQLALLIFQNQYTHNPIYNSYCKALKVDSSTVQTLAAIPFLPVSFFKTHEVITASAGNYELFFESSGTTGIVNARHFVTDAHLYNQSLLNGFRQFYGEPAEYTLLALLPSYLERKSASLVYMAEQLMAENTNSTGGFFIREWEALHKQLESAREKQQKTILLGVTFALLDFADAYPGNLQHCIVMETGGMKGRHEEWTRARVHAHLKERWSLDAIHSEYGMTELLSQAYAKSDGLYMPANTMKVMVRDINDPLTVETSGSGCINVIDLANVNSCAFIATEDIGYLHENGSFEIMGRMDHSALRGCSLMAV